MKIYITYLNNGYEGKSEPLGAFASNELAQIFQRGSEESYGTTIEIKELEIIGSRPVPDTIETLTNNQEAFHKRLRRIEDIQKLYEQEIINKRNENEPNF